MKVQEVVIRGHRERRLLRYSETTLEELHYKAEAIRQRRSNNAIAILTVRVVGRRIYADLGSRPDDS